MSLFIEKISKELALSLEKKNDKSSVYMFPPALANALASAFEQTSFDSNSIEDARFENIDTALIAGVSLIQLGLMPVMVRESWNFGSGIFVSLTFSINYRGEKSIQVGRNVDVFTKDSHKDFWLKMKNLQIAGLSPQVRGEKITWSIDWLGMNAVNIKELLSNFDDFKRSDTEVSVGLKNIGEAHLVNDFGYIMVCTGKLITDHVNGWRIAHGRDKKKYGTLLFGESECLWIYEIT